VSKLSIPQITSLVLIVGCSAQGCVTRAADERIVCRQTIVEQQTGLAQPTTRTYGFDATGNIVLDQRDYESDGTIDWMVTYTYDADNNKVGMYSDSARATYTYDDRGNRVSEEFFGSANDRTSVTQRTISTYRLDENGRVSSRTGIREDIAGGARDEFYETHLYDAAGRTVQTSLDRDSDGSDDHRTESRYDINGNRLLREFDTDADGEPDRRVTETYDAYGNNLSFTTERFREGGIERRVSAYRHTYDGAGRPILTEIDLGANGTINSHSVFSYDREGREVSYEYYDSQDQLLVRRTTTWQCP
jgi:YD repeat-containing protein